MKSIEKTQTRGILNPKALGQEFFLSRVQPSEDLTSFIEHFWIVTWDLRERKPYTSETLPFPSVHVVIEKHQPEVYGVCTSKFSRRLKGCGRAFGIKFRPGMFYQFLGSPVSSITDRTVSLRSIFGNEGSLLRNTVIEEKDDNNCIQHVEAFFRQRVPRKGSLVAQDMRDIVERIAIDREIIRVEQISSMTGLSLRPLQRAFRQYVGVSPKWVISRYRLQEAADMLASGTNLKVSDLALQLGYYDQAHFIRDFKSSIGKTPSEYIKAAMVL